MAGGHFEALSGESGGAVDPAVLVHPTEEGMPVSSLGTESGAAAVFLPCPSSGPSTDALTVTPSTAGAPYMEPSPSSRLETGKFSGENGLRRKNSGLQRA
jgi:hypothetical protein